MPCSDLRKAYLLACEPEWMMICGGIDAVSPPPQNADGFFRGEEWMSGSYGNGSTTWICGRGRTHEEKGPQQGLLCNKQLCMCPPIRSSRAAAKYTYMNLDQTNAVIFVHDTLKNFQSYSLTVVTSQILIKFWLLVVCAPVSLSLVSNQKCFQSSFRV